MILRALPAFLLAPALASACAVCNGADAESKSLGTAFNIAIGLLLGVTMALISGGIVWFYRLEQRRKVADARYIAQRDLGDGSDAVWPAATPSPAP